MHHLAIVKIILKNILQNNAQSCNIQLSQLIISFVASIFHFYLCRQRQRQKGDYIMKHQVFGTLQKIGKSFMLPVAVLPIAGLLLGIGSTFTSTAYGSIVKEGGWLYKSLRVAADSGNIVFGLLPLLFAVAIAIGLAQKSKEIAALSAVIAYFVMNMAIMSIVKNFMDLEKLNQTPGLISSFLGFENTMNTSVLGGVIIGLVVAQLHNRYYKIKLPDMLSFFGGTHFIPIISACAAIAMGIVFAILWPLLGQGIALLGIGIAKLGYFGSFLYGFILRALIPTGLHHVFYMPFWQTALGGTAEVNGTVLEGAQNILFAQLANGDVISPSVAKFYSGNYPIMMFGFPAAALAMYHTAYKQKKAKIKGLLFSSALASFLTGITEPLEFSFLFVSPLLYFGIHCVLGGISFAVVNMLNAGVGYTFSGGALDFALYGILPGNARTNWIAVLLVGFAYAIIYYVVFRFAITKLNIKTPGREDDEDSKLYTKADYLEKKKAEAKEKAGTSTDMYEQIVDGLGGLDNIVDLDNCATRLRVVVKDAAKTDEALLKSTGAAGVIQKGNNLQVIYGTKVSTIKTELEEYIESYNRRNHNEN